MTAAPSIAISARLGATKTTGDGPPSSTTGLGCCVRTTGSIVCGCWYGTAGTRLSGLRRSCLGSDVVPARLDVGALSRIGIAPATGAASASVAIVMVMMRVMVEAMPRSLRAPANRALAVGLQPPSAQVLGAELGGGGRSGGPDGDAELPDQGRGGGGCRARLGGGQEGAGEAGGGGAAREGPGGADPGA